VTESLATADYAVAQFARKGIEAWKHPNSVTVVFPRPSEDVIRRWQVAPQRGIAHIITMPHVTRSMVDRLVCDVAESLELRTEEAQ
jgi:histidine decarboxylase